MKTLKERDLNGVENMLKKLEIHSDSDALPEPKTGLRQNCFMPLRERDDNIVKDSSAHLPKKCDSDKNKGEKENKVKLDQSQFCKENKYSETGKKIKNPVNIQEKMQEIEQIAEENDSEICRKIETPSPGPEHLKTDQSGDFETELISNLNYNAAPYFPRAKIASPNPRRGSFNISYYNEAQTLSPLFTSPEPGIFKKKRIAKNELDLSRNGYDRPKPIDLTSRRIKDGVVKWFSPQKGRGIIVVDQPPEEVFFRCETGRPKIWKCGVVKKGQRVRFCVVINADGDRLAVGVRPVGRTPRLPYGNKIGTTFVGRVVNSPSSAKELNIGSKRNCVIKVC